MISRKKGDIEIIRNLIRRTKSGSISWISLAFLTNAVKNGQADDNTSELLKVYSHNMQRQRHIPNLDNSFVTLDRNDVFVLSCSKYSSIIRLDRYSESLRRWYSYEIFQSELLRLYNIIGFKYRDMKKKQEQEQESRSITGAYV